MLENLLEQDPVKGYLQRLLTSQRFPPGLLFYGPRRVGKFTAANAFVKALQCKEHGEATCQCSSCRKIDESMHPDVVVVQPNDKNHIGIEQIRAVTSAFEYRCHEGKRKIAVVRNADNMNQQASNALLKTLEEPRGDATLVLTTNQYGQMLDTIRSRCQPVRFSYLSDNGLEVLSRRSNLEPDPVALSMMGGMYQPELIQDDAKLLRFIWDRSEVELPDKIEPAALRLELVYVCSILNYLLRAGKYEYRFVMVPRANSERLTRMYTHAEDALRYVDQGVKPFLIIQWLSNRMYEAMR